MQTSKKDEGDSDANMDMDNYHYVLYLRVALASSVAANDTPIWPGLPEGFRGWYDLSGAERHKLVKGRRLKDGGLHCMG